MELDNKEEGPVYYDEIYKKGGKNQLYHRGPEGRKDEIDMWNAALSLAGAHSSIIDLGCGTGQFAQLVVETGHTYKLGIDFSPEAIHQCKARLPEFKDKFALHNLYDAIIYDQIQAEDVVIMFEVLEHVSNDLFVLKKLLPGTKVLFSVPNFGGTSHVRKFKTEKQIEDRYSDLIEIQCIHRFGRRFLTVGIRK